MCSVYPVYSPTIKTRFFFQTKWHPYQIDDTLPELKEMRMMRRSSFWFPSMELSCPTMWRSEWPVRLQRIPQGQSWEKPTFHTLIKTSLSYFMHPSGRAGHALIINGVRNTLARRQRRERTRESKGAECVLDHQQPLLRHQLGEKGTTCQWNLYQFWKICWTILKTTMRRMRSMRLSWIGLYRWAWWGEIKLSARLFLDRNPPHLQYSTTKHFSVIRASDLSVHPHTFGLFFLI